MTEKGYFTKMAAYVLAGLLALVVTIIIIVGLSIAFAPIAGLIIAAVAGTLLSIAVLVLLFLFIFGVVYLCLFLGVLINYIRKPMQVKPGSYSIKASSEAGKGSKGSSRQRKSPKKPKK